MTNLKKFYEEVERNEALKAALVAANEEAKGYSQAEAQSKLIAIAKAFGYTLTADDFVEKEGELDMDDLEDVAGGWGVCVVSNCACSFFGSIDSKGGCILVGAYR